MKTCKKNIVYKNINGKRFFDVMPLAELQQMQINKEQENANFF